MFTVFSRPSDAGRHVAHSRWFVVFVPGSVLLPDIPRWVPAPRETGGRPLDRVQLHRAALLALTSCARAGLLLAPISCLARAITPRAPSADRLRGAIGATQNTLQSLSCRGQYGCSVVKGVPPAPDCPCIALASCLARAAHGLTDPHVHAQTTSEFLRQPELSAPVGGRALGRRSEGSLFAAELLRAGL